MEGLSTGLTHEPVDAALLPGGELGNHGIDAEINGLRPAVLRTEGLTTTVRCAGGTGWHIDPLGRHALYPHIHELALRLPAVELSEDDTAALQAWAHEGVPVRLRGLVGDTPALVLDDGWRVVVLGRSTVHWTLSAA